MTPAHARSRRAPCGSGAGFTFVELMIAMALVLAVSGAVFAVIGPASRVFRAQPEAADVQQRLRAAIDILQKDLLMAGAGLSHVPPVRGPLVDHFAPVLPYRAGPLRSDPAAGIFHRPDAVTVFYVPWTTAQTQIAGVGGGGTTFDVTAAANCAAPPDRLCGFQQGMHVLLFDRAGARDTATIEDVAGKTMTLRRSGMSSAAFDPDEAAIAEAVAHTYYLKVDVQTGTSQLMHYDGHLGDFPVVDHVVALEFTYFGEPRPPALLPDVDLAAATGPWTTYGPRPPPIDRDDPRDGWPAGENCAFAVVDGMHAPRLAHLPAAGSLATLDRSLLTDGPWCPDPADGNRYDADLLRVRRIRVRLRVQAAAASMRGPAGLLFSTGGTSASMEQFVPDREIGFDVAPRNMNLGR